MNPGSTDIPPSPMGVDYAQAERMVAERRMRSGADWFFWIAGLTLIGTVATLFFHTTFGFALGLGTTYIVEGVMRGVGQAISGGSGAMGASIAAFAVDLVILGIYCLFAIFGRKGIPAAFVVGMVFYALDTLVFLIQPAQAILALVFHVYALYCLFNGYKAAKALRALNARQIVQVATPYAEPAQSGVWPPPPGAPYNP